MIYDLILSLSDSGSALEALFRTQRHRLQSQERFFHYVPASLSQPCSYIYLLSFSTLSDIQ